MMNVYIGQVVFSHLHEATEAIYQDLVSNFLTKIRIFYVFLARGVTREQPCLWSREECSGSSASNAVFVSFFKFVGQNLAIYCETV